MGQVLRQHIGRLQQQGRPGLEEQISITWLRYGESLVGAAEAIGEEEFRARKVSGACWAGGTLRYPASVVKLVYLVAAEAWLKRQLLEDGPELRRALADMVRDSGNDATSLVLDLLSGTTSGPSLPPERHSVWCRQRQLVNVWLSSLGWAETEGVNACQKTWAEEPYGRERDFYGPYLENRNRLSTEFTARLLHAVMAGAVVSPPACHRMRSLLWRSLDLRARAADPENQVDGFLGAGLPEGAQLWSKAGWMSQARHDAAYLEVEGRSPMLLVAFSEGPAMAADATWLPSLAALLLEA